MIHAHLRTLHIFYLSIIELYAVRPNEDLKNTKTTTATKANSRMSSLNGF